MRLISSLWYSGFQDLCKAKRSDRNRACVNECESTCTCVYPLKTAEPVLQFYKNLANFFSACAKFNGKVCTWVKFFARFCKTAWRCFVTCTCVKVPDDLQEFAEVVWD